MWALGLLGRVSHEGLRRRVLVACTRSCSAREATYS
jgi:hypothetical protein